MNTNHHSAPTRLVIFDWDGTLFDSTGIIGHSLQQSCMALNLGMPTMAQAQHVIGLGFNEAIEQLVGVLTPEQTAEFMVVYRRNYFASENLITLFKGIDETLQALKNQGKDLAIATGKSRAGLDRVLGHNPMFKQYFSSSRTADETRSKPDPLMLLELLDELDVLPEHAIMVGDTTYDIQMAHGAKMRSIAVTYGAHNEETLMSAQPSFYAHNVSELAQILEHV